MQFAYERVSTEDQNLDLQRDALTAYGYDKIFSEKISGKKLERPEFYKLQEQVRPGDTVIVWKLDRIGRDFKDLINIFEGWKNNGITFISLTEGIDTSDEFGVMVLRFMAMLADYERAKLRERVLAGLASARARGRVGGKKEILNSKEIFRLQELHEQKELSITELMDMFRISKTTLYRYLNKSAFLAKP